MSVSDLLISKLSNHRTRLGHLPLQPYLCALVTRLWGNTGAGARRTQSWVQSIPRSPGGRTQGQHGRDRFISGSLTAGSRSEHEIR